MPPSFRNCGRRTPSPTSLRLRNYRSNFGLRMSRERPDQESAITSDLPARLSWEKLNIAPHGPRLRRLREAQLGLS